MDDTEEVLRIREDLSETMEAVHELVPSVQQNTEGIRGLRDSVESLRKTVQQLAQQVAQQAVPRGVSTSSLIGGSTAAATIAGVLGILLSQHTSGMVSPLSVEIQNLRAEMQSHAEEGDHPYGVMMQVQDLRGEHRALTERVKGLENIVSATVGMEVGRQIGYAKGVQSADQEVIHEAARIRAEQYLAASEQGG